MRLLVIHTAGAEGTVALAGCVGDDVRVVAAAVLPGRSASERLVVEVRRLLEGAGWRLADLAAVVVVHGPGSFTGVRVGLSAAKGLVEAGGVALIAVSRLALLAAAAGPGAVVHAVLDAGRGEFYYGLYEDGACLREALLAGSEVVAAVGGAGRVVACEAKVTEGLAGLEILLVDEPLAAAAVPIALARLAAGAVDDAAVVDANYLRRTDFEIRQRQELRALGERGAQ
jgi:tRNA threonylcarbamoyladenosine biosynthesis protein TsaB